MRSFCNVHEVLAAFVPFFILHDSQVKRFDNPCAGDTWTNPAFSAPVMPGLSLTLLSVQFYSRILTRLNIHGFMSHPVAAFSLPLNHLTLLIFIPNDLIR